MFVYLINQREFNHKELLKSYRGVQKNLILRFNINICY